MNKEELRESLDDAGNNIVRLSKAISRWNDLLDATDEYRANEDAQIYKQLYDAFEDILNPDQFPRLRDPQGHKVSIQIGDHILTISVTHRGVGIEDIHGVDVIYHYGREKALAFQHKKRSREGLLVHSDKDRQQKEKITNLCGLCKTPQRAKGSHTYVRPYCSSLYVIGNADGKKMHFVSACMLDQYRSDFRTHEGRNHVRIPTPGDGRTIDAMFLMCLVGRKLKDEKEVASLASIRDSSLAAPNLVIDATLEEKKWKD